MCFPTPLAQTDSLFLQLSIKIKAYVLHVHKCMASFMGAFFCSFILVLEHHFFLNWHEQDNIHVANGLCVPLQANLSAPSPTTTSSLITLKVT